MVLSLLTLLYTHFCVILTIYSWRWLGQLKQADGGFQVSLGGEQDVRSVYLLLLLLLLLTFSLVSLLTSSEERTALW